MSRNKAVVNSSDKRGFTIVEMLIIAPIVILTIGAFITAIVSMTGEVLATRSSNVLAYSIQDSLNRIEEDVKLSTTFLAATNVTVGVSQTPNDVVAGQGYTDGTSTTGFTNANSTASNKGDILILNALVTLKNPLDPTGGLVYLAGKPNACTDLPSEIMQNVPMTMNIVYFVKDQKLWRRTVMPINYTTAADKCGNPWQQPSCLPGNTATFCKAKDVLLIDGIDPSEFIVQYFYKADATAATQVASDPTNGIPERTTAIQPLATVGVSINVTKTAAGRDIAASGTLRATKLDTNASTIAPIVPDVIPDKPTVTASFNAPDTAKFTWPAVPGASSYTLNYTTDAGGTNIYVSGLTNSTALTFSTTGIRNQVACATVYANSSAGTSPQGYACITIPPWNNLVFQNSWSDYSNSYATGAYTKTSAGVVVLKGLVKRAGTPGGSETIAVLPAGYRPAEQLIFQTTTTPDVASRVDVTPGGNIILSVGSGGWVSLEGIKFLPPESSYTFTNFSLLNSWVFYGAPYAVPGYTLDSNNRVHMKALVKNGTGTIATLPVGYRPSLNHYLPADATNAFGDFELQSSGAVVPSAYTNSYFSIQSMTYPASYPSGTTCTTSWCNLTLLNGWVTYGGWLSSPQYTKAADGIVTVKGFIASGTTTTGTVIGTLPVGYRPKEILLTGGAAWNAQSRIDIQPNGDIVARTVSSGWTSLENINFMAEQ